MFRKLTPFLLALLLIVFTASGAFANKISVTGFVVDNQGEMSYKSLNELMTTNDTVTAAETGKVFIIDAATTSAHMTLPAAAAGLTYEFIGADTTYFLIVPNGTDTIKLLTLAAGDSVASSGAVGDKITLVATTTGTWYASVDGGTFVDKNGLGD
jgi:hypothetical protein